MIISFVAVIVFFLVVIALLPVALYIKNTDRDCRQGMADLTVRDYYRMCFGRGL